MRTFIFCILSTFILTTSYAQNIDIQTLVLSPEPGFDIVENDTFSITIGIYNNGNTTIESTDSIYLTFFIDEQLISTQEGSRFLMRRPNADSTAQIEIAVGDTAFQVISLAVPPAYIPLFQNDIICFISELYHANSTTPVLETNTENNKGCNNTPSIHIDTFEDPFELYTLNQFVYITGNVNAKLMLYDYLGQLVQTTVLDPGDNSLDISNLPKAVYFYSIQNNHIVLQTGKLLK